MFSKFIIGHLLWTTIRRKLLQFFEVENKCRRIQFMDIVSLFFSSHFYPFALFSLPLVLCLALPLVLCLALCLALCLSLSLFSLFLSLSLLRSFRLSKSLESMEIWNFALNRVIQTWKSISSVVNFIEKIKYSIEMESNMQSVLHTYKKTQENANNFSIDFSFVINVVLTLNAVIEVKRLYSKLVQTSRKVYDPWKMWSFCVLCCMCVVVAVVEMVFIRREITLFD